MQLNTRVRTRATAESVSTFAREHPLEVFTLLCLKNQDFVEPNDAKNFLKYKNLRSRSKFILIFSSHWQEDLLGMKFPGPWA
jgi:hypothetical protein